MPNDLIRLENADLTLLVSALGAEMQSLRTAAGQELLWQGDPAVWSGRAPVLFPIVGRARDNLVAAGPHEAEMAQHGFARRSVFALTELAQDATCHTLEDSPETHALYPFAFALSVSHRLNGRTLEVVAEVENRDGVAIPFGFGFHPGFAWPLPGGEGQPHEVQLDNGAEPALVRLQDGLIPPGTLPSPFAAGRLALAPALFDEDAMIFPEGAGKGLRYGVPGGPQLRFRFENLPNLALWTKPGAPYLCVEPWHGMAARSDGSAQIAERPYSLSLAPGETARFAYSVEIAL